MAPSAREDSRQRTVRPSQTVRASHRRGSSTSGSDGIASADSHMRDSVASSVSSTTVSQNARPCRVLLALHLHAEQSLEHRIAGLALAVATHRLLDPAVRAEQLRPERVHHVVAVPLGRRHERLDPRRASAAARRRARRRTGPRRTPSGAWSASGSAASSAASCACIPSMSIVSVDRKSSSSSPEPFARPRPRELEAVRHLVQRHPASGTRSGRATSRVSNGAMLGTTNSSGARPRPGHGHVELTEHPLREEPQHLSHLRAHQQRRDLAQNASHRLHLGWQLLARSPDPSPRRSAGPPARGGSRGSRRSRSPTRRAGRRAPAATSPGGSSPVNRATCSSATRTASSKTGRSASVGSRSSPASTALAIADLAGELPVHRAARRRHHTLQLAEQRSVLERLGVARRTGTRSRVAAAHGVIVRPALRYDGRRVRPSPPQPAHARPHHVRADRRRRGPRVRRRPRQRAAPASSSAPCGTTRKRAT